MRCAPRRFVATLLALAAALHATAPAAAELMKAGVARRASDIWRVTGRVRTRDGARYAVAVTFFRYPLAPAHRGDAGGFDAAALSIVDEDARRIVTAVRVEREGFGLAYARTAQPALRVDDWTFRSERAGRLARERLHVAEGATSFDATLVERVPRTRIDGGFASTRVAASGILVMDGRRSSVRGSFWIDREERFAGAILRDDTWRFAIALDDGRALLLRATRRHGSSAGVATNGFIRAANGTVTYLTSSDVRIWNPLGTAWRNAHGEAYPSLFEAVIPRFHLDLALVPVVQDWEIDGDGRGVPFYGANLDVERASPGPRDTGVGYVELTGYAGAIRPSL